MGSKPDRFGTPEERFWRKVMKTDTCWLWTGAKASNGYGRFVAYRREQVPAHRFAYALMVGPIPEGFQIDHLCRVRLCVNAEHLEPVTQQENIKRGLAGWLERERTQCPQGHPYDGDNTLSYKGRRYCRSCHRIRSRDLRARRLEANREQ